jgi:zinc transporter ZupT
VINLQSSSDGSKALVIASVLTGIVHVLLGILGTFVLKRFPTSFSVGFFLGVLVILANQNLIMFGTFHSYSYGSPGTNHAFANLGLSLFCVLFFFTLLLFHFKKSIVVAPVNAKGLGRNADRTDSSTDYCLDET